MIVPNGALSNGTIINYSTEGWVRVDLVVGIAYEADIDQAKAVLLEAMAANEKILKDPAPFVGVQELGDSSVNLASRPFCKSEDYWQTLFYMQENVKKEFDKVGISIPFPQMDVHLDKVN